MIYVNVESPNLGFPYFNFLGEAQCKNTLYMSTLITPLDLSMQTTMFSHFPTYFQPSGMEFGLLANKFRCTRTSWRTFFIWLLICLFGLISNLSNLIQSELRSDPTAYIKFSEICKIFDITHLRPNSVKLPMDDVHKVHQRQRAIT